MPCEEKPFSPRNVPMKTLGGKQFWADVLHLHGWRIQRNAVTGHYRLLNPKNTRKAWGSFEHCREQLDGIAKQQNLAPMTGRVVIVLHGLFRTRSSMGKLCRYLREEGDLTVLNVSYPTTRGNVGDHAKQLATLVDNLPEVERIDFVTHSLGGLVVRHWMGDQLARGESIDPRVTRIVMYGPPHHGAVLAKKLIPIDVSRKLTGDSANQLARGWEELEPKLAVPPCEFGIIAGGRGEAGTNPLVQGDDDLVVSVESTRLAGARDFRRLDVIHTTMMRNPTVLQYTLRFLEHGYFESEETSEPILADEPNAPQELELPDDQP